MITATGYSKDTSIRPEGVVITFGREMMLEQGGAKVFLQNFLECMEDADTGRYWMHKCSNLPTMEIDHIYIIVLNRLWGKVYCGGKHLYNPSEPQYGYSADGKEKIIDWNYIALAGPFEHCPFKRVIRGHQGFRYCTQLW